MLWYLNLSKEHINLNNQLRIWNYEHNIICNNVENQYECKLNLDYQDLKMLWYLNTRGVNHIS